MATAAANSVDLSGLNRLLRDLQAVTGADMGELLQQEARLWLKQVFRFTPPPGPSTKAKKAGEQAVQSDIMRIVSAAERGFIEASIEANNGNPDFISIPFHKKDGSPIFLEWGHARTNADGLREFHQKNRDSRGRVTRAGSNTRNIGRWKALNKFIVPHDVRAAYIAKVKRSVGYLRSGWKRAFTGLKMKTPPWVRRHDAPGFYTEKIDKTTDQFIELANAGKGISQIAHAAASATRTRERNLRRRIKIALSGYAKNTHRKQRVRRQVQKIAPVSTD